MTSLIIRVALLSTLVFSTSIYADTQTVKTLALEANNGSAVLPDPATADNKTPLSSEADRISYALGVDIGRTFKSQNLTANPTIMAQGITDGLSGGKTLMTQKEMQDTLINFQKSLIAKRQAQLDQMGEANQQNGDAFLAANKTKPGVVTLPDGLQYKIIKEGSGNTPTDKDTVTVNYTGSFINGQVFDSSYARGKPVSFSVAQIIPGWTEALKMMKPGAVWEIYVPPTLAYGKQGAGPIGPNQTLIFKIELIAVNPNTGPTPGK